MRVFRIAKKKWIKDMSGRGAELSGGRWNLKGTPALYTSDSLALCVCEVLVHTDKDIPPANMYYAELEIPDALISDTYVDFDWSKDSTALGTELLRRENELAIRVPSLVVPEGYNVIVNPRHTNLVKIKTIAVKPFQFDSRFFP